MKTTRLRTVCDVVRGGAKFRWPLAFAMALLVCTPGCLILPTPEFNSGNARANINKQTPKQFAPGKTTRAEIILALGEPDAVSPDESKLAYRSEKVCGFWFVGAGYSGAGGTIQKDRYLVAEFDGQGMLQTMERSATWAGSSPTATVVAPVATANASAPSGAPPQAAIRMQKPARWLAGMDGYKPSGATGVLGEPGQLILMDAKLEFTSNSQFANSPPALALDYEKIVEVRVDKYIFGRRLVIRCRGDEVHSFDVLGPKAMSTDKQALLAVAEFLQARIKH